MMVQGERNTVAKLAGRRAILDGEVHRPLAFVGEGVGIELAELPDQAALAMEVDGIAVARLQAIDAHRRAAARLLGEIARLAPLQGFREPAYAPRPRGGIEHQLTQRHQLGAHGGWVSLEQRRPPRVGEPSHACLHCQHKRDFPVFPVFPAETVVLLPVRTRKGLGVRREEKAIMTVYYYSYFH